MQAIGLRDRIQGCLLGGALGDALGAPVEFLSLRDIRQRFGPAGIRALGDAYGRVGAITDDTQMTLFTAEGLLRAWVRHQDRGIVGITGVMHHAYLRWLLTQGERPGGCADAVSTDGWLFALPALHHPRAPGATCLSALRAATSIHATGRAGNDSKGCGGVMRMAPVGLVGAALGDDTEVFGIAVDAAALTHGHPSGFLSAGYLAVAIAHLVRGEDLGQALRAGDVELGRWSDCGEVQRAIAAARALAARGLPTPEQLEGLGGGWVAEEALAIAVCCAIAAEDFRDCVIVAANHSGDTDSTAAIAGNLMGARLGVGALPPEWLDVLELRSEITQLADDLTAVAEGTARADDMRVRYPGW
jgi:ADP-ribosylglycohydrolase